jgi:bla regulator protein blaR1
MPFTLPSLPAAGPLMHAICWTLVHSLWQGLLAAIVAGIIMLATKQSSARLRYTLLAVLFFGLVVASAGTFLVEACKEPQDTGALSAFSEQVAGNTAMGLMPAGGQNGHSQFSGRPVYAAPVATVPTTSFSLLSRVEAFCNTHAFLITSVWLLILLLRLAQTGLSLTYVQRIRRLKTRPVSSDWEERVRALADRIGLSRPIALLESALIQAPMVIGYFKPVILVPLGILTQLPQNQLEAVLLHELAHIRRNDYLVNLLQSLAETLLFFNPAIWWISALIREERENCCDDVAIDATRNKAQLIQALVAFQELSIAAGPAYAVAFPGRKMPLLDRITRILQNKNKTLNAMEKTLLTACLIAACSLTVAFSPLNPHRPLAHLNATLHRLMSKDTVAPPPPPAPVPVPTVPADVAPTPVTPPDTLPVAPPAPNVSADELEGGSFRGSLRTDDHKIEYARGIWTKDNTAKYFMDSYEIVQVDGATTAIYISGKRIPNEELDNYKPIVAKVIAQLEDESKDQARAYSSRSYSGYDSSYNDVVVTGRGAVGRARSITFGSGDSAITVTSEPHQDVAFSGSSASAGGGSNVSFSGKVTFNTTDGSLGEENPIAGTTEPILKDIFAQHLASDSNHVSFTLNYHHFIVNDVKQPDDIFIHYRDRYVEGKKDSYVYTRNGGNISSTVTQNKEH